MLRRAFCDGPDSCHAPRSWNCTKAKPPDDCPRVLSADVASTYEPPRWASHPVTGHTVTPSGSPVQPEWSPAIALGMTSRSAKTGRALSFRGEGFRPPAKDDHVQPGNSATVSS